MPRVELLEPFDDIQTADLSLLYLLYGSSGETIISPGRSGSGKALQMAGATSEVKFTLASPETQLVTGIGLNVASFWSTETWFFIQDSAGADQLVFKYNGDGSIAAYRGATLLATSAAGVLVPGIWTHFEIKAKIHGSAGYVAIRANGGTTPILSFTGNTQATAQVNWLSCGPRRSYNSLWFDDWFIISGNGGDADWHGDCWLRALLPNGAGSASQWTPNGAGANYTKVNENPQDGDTTYVSDATPGNRDLYTYEDAGAFSGVIRAVMLRSFMRKDDAGTRQVRTVCKSGSTVAIGTTVTLSTSLDGYQEMLENDPATGQPWTAAGINAAEFGIETVT